MAAIPRAGELHQSATNSIDVDGLVGLHIARNREDQGGLQIDGLSELAGFHRIPTAKLQTDFSELLDIDVGVNVDGGTRSLEENEARISRRGGRIRALVVFFLAGAILDRDGARDLNRNRGAIKCGGEQKIRSASFVEDVLQARAVEGQMKSMCAGYVKCGCISAGGNNANRETRGLRGGVLRVDGEFLFVGGDDGVFGEGF